ncbi:hypothetical protein KUTeg_017781, partial [Tegillarca granosa]
MPTVLALDVSLSMSRPVQMADCTEEYQRRNLAIHGIETLIDYMTQNCCVFILMGAAALNKVDEYNKTCIESALTGVSSKNGPVFLTVRLSSVTDGSVGFGPKSLRHSLQTWDQRDSSVAEEKFPLPFPFPCKLHVILIGNPNDPELKSSLPLFEKLVEINGQGGEVFVPDSALSLKSVQSMFLRLAEKFHEFELVHKEVSSTLDVLGFLDIADVAGPQTLSRHLVLPRTIKDRQKKK